ncbi:DUF2852 domain-containing protein [Parvularcula oceani]|uniref:DUF2852 domain-containing protein n=1 Tax=Parvularcula oceani TaxID=1247963 RepID=UPI00068F19E9|nr:DUF2852 domain-containing protein [Parvularcula oceani]
MSDAKAKAKVFDEQEFSRQLRPAWTPLNIALMVFMFVVGLWPLGLAMIVYMSYGREMGIDLSNWGRAKKSASRAMDGVKWSSDRTTGNAAFDEWRDNELKRLDEERRKLDEARREFDEYVQELRRARDRDEFETFQNKRRGQSDDTQA